LIAAAQQPTVADQQLLLEAVAVGMDTAPDVLGCTLTELDGQGGYRSVAASTELAAALDQAQFDAGNGPCLAAARDNQEKHIDSMAGDDRFPDFSGAAITRGVRSSLSLPLRGTRRPSSLNWYAADLAAFSSPRICSLAAPPGC
jgi:hypothetical protein